MSEVPTAPAEGQEVAVDLDLDADRPSTFRMRGQVFRIRHVGLSPYGEAVEKLDEAEGRVGSKLHEIWEAQADFIEFSIHPDDVGRFRDLRANQDDSDNLIEPRDLRKLYAWLWEVHTGRPTKSAEASLPGPGSSEASSTAESGSVEVVRPT